MAGERSPLVDDSAGAPSAQPGQGDGAALVVGQDVKEEKKKHQTQMCVGAEPMQRSSDHGRGGDEILRLSGDLRHVDTQRRYEQMPKDCLNVT